MCQEKGQVITNRLTIEKMAEDAFIYPQKYYFHYDYNDLCTIRRVGTFTRAYTKTIVSLSEDSFRILFEESSQYVPSNLKLGLVCYVVNTHFKIDEIDLFGLMKKTLEALNPSMMPRRWYYPALIVSETVPVTGIKVNVLFSTYKCGAEEDDESIKQQLEQYREEQMRKINPDYGCLFADLIPEFQAQREQKEKEERHITKRILFIGGDNACRSAVAESILKKILSDSKRNDIKVESAGTIDWGENPRDTIMVQIAAEHGYIITGKTKYMSTEQLCEADLILVMAPRHKHCIRLKLINDKCEKVHLFMNYCLGIDESLQDPIGQGEEIYREVFDAIEKGCKLIANSICE